MPNPTRSNPTDPTDLTGALHRAQRGIKLRNAMAARDPIPSDLTSPLLDAVQLFDALHIGYALVGGLAAMQYGRARFTEDVDFIAVTGHENQLKANPDTMRNHHFALNGAPTLYHNAGIEIDIWKDEHADAIISRARKIDLAGRTVRIADPHDLIAMKLRADRPQDDYDISEIVKHTEIDDHAIQSRVTPDQFGRYSAIKKRIGIE